jgi:mRNA-degrading endonuclease toxin of MazEF toxin-antitoxin module
MAAYRRGDVVLALVRIDGRGEAKVRPAVVIGQESDDALRVLPTTSRYPADASCISIGLLDFAEGGLDMHEASFVLTASECTVHTSQVRTRKGRLAPEPMEAIIAAIPTVPTRSGTG